MSWTKLSWTRNWIVSLSSVSMEHACATRWHNIFGPAWLAPSTRNERRCPHLPRKGTITPTKGYTSSWKSLFCFALLLQTLLSAPLSKRANLFDLARTPAQHLRQTRRRDASFNEQSWKNDFFHLARLKGSCTENNRLVTSHKKKAWMFQVNRVSE